MPHGKPHPRPQGPIQDSARQGFDAAYARDRTNALKELSKTMVGPGVAVSEKGAPLQSYGHRPSYYRISGIIEG